MWGGAARTARPRRRGIRGAVPGTHATLVRRRRGACEQAMNGVQSCLTTAAAVFFDLVCRLGLGVLVRGEDLPRLAVRRGHPDLVLPRVAAGGVHLVESGQSGFHQASLRAQDVVRRANLDSGVVEGSQVLAALALVEGEVERRLGELEPA